ncbi:MAG: hypothetical protein P8X95_21210 [Anaerolineales bacterium]
MKVRFIGLSRTTAGLYAILFLVLSSCSNLSISEPRSFSAAQSMPSTSTSSPAPSPSPTRTPTQTLTPTLTPTPSETPTPTLTFTPTITPTPTFDFPDVIVQMQANCRYGPGTAYLYAHGLFEGDHGIVHGRNYSGSWLWIKPDNLDWHCWVSNAVVEVDGDVHTVVTVQRKLPHSTLYGPPKEVNADRNGDRVIVSWEPVWMTEDDDRGYLIEATTCQGGNLVWSAVHTDDNSFEFSDESNCSGESGGLLYTVEKHGYTDPVKIPWP